MLFFIWSSLFYLLNTIWFWDTLKEAGTRPGITKAYTYSFVVFFLQTGRTYIEVKNVQRIKVFLTGHFDVRVNKEETYAWPIYIYEAMHQVEMLLFKQKIREKTPKNILL